MAGGMTTEVFGSSIVLIPGYEGECDCSAVFAHRSVQGDPILIGKLERIETSTFSYTFSSSMFASFLSPTQDARANRTADNASSPEAFASAVLRPISSTKLQLKIADVCAYTLSVQEGVLLQVRLPEATLTQSSTPLSGLSTAEQHNIVLTRLDPSDVDGVPSNLALCAGIDDCDFTCFFSGRAKLSEDRRRIIGSSPNSSCVCPVHSLTVVDGYVSVPEWTIVAMPESNALFYTYRAQATECHGYLNVEFGTFLGIPRNSSDPPDEDPDEESDSTPRSRSGPDALTVEAARKASDVMASVLATAVGISVIATILSSIATAMGSGVAAAVGATGAFSSAATASMGQLSSALSTGGGTGPAALSLISQVQLMAIAGRIGAAEQPASTRAFSSGLEWINFHLFKLRGGPATSSDNAEGESRRARGKGSGVVEEESDFGLVRGCDEAAWSSRELGATVLACAATIAASSVARLLLNALVRCLEVRNGVESEGPAVPAFAWEFQIFLLQFPGLAEAAGESIASNCLAYEAGGALILFVLVATAAGVLLILIWAVRTRAIRWEKSTLRESIASVKAELHQSKGRGCVHRVRVLYAAFVVINHRGEWTSQDKNGEENKAGNHVIDRLGAFFDGNAGGAWWYGFWQILKTIATCVILAAVFTPTTNAVAVLALNCIDSAFIVCIRPHGMWMSYLRETYKGLLNLATISSVLAYLNNTLPENWFSNLFIWLSFLSVIPSALCCVLEPVVRGVVWFQTFMYKCGGIFTSVRLGAAAGGAAQLALVMRGDDAAHDKALRAVERHPERRGSHTSSDGQRFTSMEGGLPTVNSESSESDIQGLDRRRQEEVSVLATHYISAHHQPYAYPPLPASSNSSWRGQQLHAGGVGSLRSIPPSQPDFYQRSELVIASAGSSRHAGHGAVWPQSTMPASLSPSGTMRSMFDDGASFSRAYSAPDDIASCSRAYSPQRRYPYGAKRYNFVM